jgi:putative transposase
MQGQHYRLLYHFTWATKMRCPTVENDMKEGLYKFLRGKVLEFRGRAMAIGGTGNHVHLVVSLTPNIDISTFIGRIKGSSTHWINHTLRPGRGFAWQNGFAVSTITDEVLQAVCNYVNNQEEHHKEGTINREMELADI